VTSQNVAILSCICEHKYQDSKYGKGMRVHNRKQGGKALLNNMYRCTVCGREKTK
jgi:hypothetical protein